MTTPILPNPRSTAAGASPTVIPQPLGSTGTAEDAGGFTFPAVARLELDDLLVQLIERAQEVLRTQDRLRGLVSATQAISSDLDLPTLLARIVEQARTLIGARYAALGVVGDDGDLTQFVHSGMAPALVTEIGHLPTGRGLLGQLITDPRPLRLVTLAEHPSSVGFPPGHPPMSSFLGVPVRIRGHVFGNLYLTEKTDGEQFSAEDEELALSLASAAAAAIDNARLFEAISSREHWLEASRSLTNELLHVSDRDEALGLLTRAVRAASGADLAAVVAATPAGSLSIAAIDGHGADRVLGAFGSPDSPAARSLAEGQPLLVEDVSPQRDTTGPIAGLGVGPLAAVPLAAQDQVLGSLVVANLPGRRTFTKSDLDLLGDFAAQAAVVLLVAAAQEAAKEVEMGEERARIARDLHDHAIQGIFAVGLGLHGLGVRVAGRDGRAIAQYVDELDDTIKAIRRSIFALQRPATAGTPTGLRARIAQVCDEAARSLGFTPVVHTEGPVDSLVPDDVAHDAVGVLREALSNTAHHAEASRVEVTVLTGPQLTVEIRDNGVGLGASTRSSGLGNMRDRAARHGGTCEIGPAEGGGTVVRWVVPLGDGAPD